MKQLTRVLVPCLALAALTAACENDDDIVNVGTNNTASVRFVNAVQGSGNMALTANGSMVGSAQTFGPNSSVCSTVNTASPASFAFGTANSGGTGISGTATSFNQTLASGGNYTVVATGTAANPSYIFLNNTPTTAASAGFANVRFVNATGASSFDAFATTGGAALGTASATGLNAATSASASSFMTVPITNNTFTFTTAGSTTPVSSTSSGSFNSGGNYTVLLLPGATAGTYQTLVFNSSCQ